MREKRNSLYHHQCNANRKRKDSQHQTSSEQCRPSCLSTLHESTPSSNNINIPGPSKVFKNLQNKSEEKLKNSLFTEIDSSPSKLIKTRSTSRKLGLGIKARSSETFVNATGYKLIDMNLLQDSVSNFAVCRHCKNQKSTLKILSEPKSRCGLAEKLSLKCSRCNNLSSFYTSQRLSQKTANNNFDINVRSVHASQNRMGHSGLNDFCATMDMGAPVTSNAYTKIMKNLSTNSVDLAEKLMNDAAERITQKISEENPEQVKETKYGTLAYIAVTVDGTWQRRGHSSKNGVVFIISMDTGEVLDYVVKTITCHTCLKHETDGKDSDQYKTWKVNHECTINHVGSAASMETEGAKEMFLRSIEKRKLVYETYVGDGDTGTFGHVKASCYDKFSEDYIVHKEECVGHIQKRLGSGLREYKRKKRGEKLSDGKPVGGKGRVTDKVVDKMQNYFGEAIRNNAGNKELMTKAVWAIYHHMICNDSISLKEQHSFCPKGPSSWCTFWRDPSSYDSSKRLPSVFLNELKPLFTRLTADELLSRCMQGFTQNQNESINNVLWNRCPKTIFCGRERLLLAVSETVCTFNTGAASKVMLLKSAGISPGHNMLKAYRKSDKMRVQRAAKKISNKARLQRRKLRGKKKSKTVDNETYLAGSFGVGTQPECLLESNVENKIKPVIRKRKLKHNLHDLKKINSPIEFEVVSSSSEDVIKVSQDVLLLTFIDEKDIPLVVNGVSKV